MTGVEILNTIYEYESLISPGVAFCGLLVCLIIAIIGALTIYRDTAQRILIVLFAIASVCSAVCFIGSLIKTDKISDTKYQVVVSEDVNFEDFMDKYEILDQDGEIYTVRERE